jgi:hypothetical protein
LVNPNLLFLGTEFTLWVSLDRGQNWSQFGQGLPTVAIHEVAMHPANGEIVVATHGRSLWACDITGLRSLKPEHIAKDIAFHEPHDVIRWRRDLRRGRTNRRYIGNNPSSGAQLWYSLPSKAERVAFRIENIDGQVISELTGNGEAGLHRVSWNLTGSVQRRPGGGAGSGRTRGGRPVSNGTYRVVMIVDGKELPSRTVTLVQDPTLPADSIADELYEEMLLEDQRAADLKRKAKSEGRSHYQDD